jgi:hypothetical protein
MSMTAREAFRQGVLYGIASRGFTPAELGTALLKQAGVFGDVIGKGMQSVGMAGKGVGAMGDAAAAAAIGVPLLAGVGMGAGYFSATRPDYDTSIKQLQHDRLVRELILRTRELKRKQQPAAPVTGPTLAV